MIARFDLCERRQLELAIADRLSQTDSERLSAHLEHCAHCRGELAELAGDATWWDEAKSLLSSSDEVVLIREGNRLPPLDSLDDDLTEDVSGMLESSDNPTSIGRIGSYEIEEVVGRGGMGIVFKAQDPGLHRHVAIKVLASHLAARASARKRFAYEAQAAAAVVHDHVIAIHSIDSSGRLPYLVMPYIAGPSLQDRIDANGPLSTSETLRIAMQTARGLAAAHAQGLVHRDIKPANILLENGVERVRITDFGLARAIDDASQTQSGFIAGTPQYMSPEQARGEAVDARADLFSLGSVMYTMCTGHSPFRAETTLAVLRRICDDAPRSLREVNPNVPTWLEQIILRLLSKSPAERYSSASEVADVLEKWLAHVQQPTVFEPPEQVAPRPTKINLEPRAVSWARWTIPAVMAVCLAAVAVWQGPKMLNSTQQEQRQPKVVVRPPAAAQQVSAERSEALPWKEFDAEIQRAREEMLLLESRRMTSDPARGFGPEIDELDHRVRWLEGELGQYPLKF